MRRESTIYLFKKPSEKKTKRTRIDLNGFKNDDHLLSLHFCCVLFNKQRRKEAIDEYLFTARIQREKPTKTGEKGTGEKIIKDQTFERQVSDPLVSLSLLAGVHFYIKVVTAGTPAGAKKTGWQLKMTSRWCVTTAAAAAAAVYTERQKRNRTQLCRRDESKPVAHFYCFVSDWIFNILLLLLF